MLLLVPATSSTFPYKRKCSFLYITETVCFDALILQYLFGQVAAFAVSLKKIIYLE